MARLLLFISLLLPLTLQIILEPFVAMSSPRLVRQDLVPLAAAASGDVKVTFLAINDVYELLPTGGLGGLARLATLKKTLETTTEVICTLQGDFLSPSAMGSVMVQLPDGGPPVKLAGHQMVDALNYFVDIATFGNHEFDNKDNEMVANLAFAKFSMVATNVFNKTTQEHFQNTVPVLIKEVSGIRFCFLSLTINHTSPEYVNILNFEDSVNVLRHQIKTNKKNFDVLILLTHQTIELDGILAELLEDENIDLILGGHMHQNYLVYRGFKKPVRIAEADSNSHTAFVHTLTIDPQKKVKHIESVLHFIDSSIPDDPVVAARAAYWTDLGYAGFAAAGFVPTEVVTILPTPLVALSRIIENQHNELTHLVTEAIILRYSHATVSLVNAGAMRLDDIIPAGPITQYDILRLCPYDNNVWLARLPGYILIQALSIGTTTNQNLGAFIHYEGVELVEGVWRFLATQEPINNTAFYEVASTDFLLGGHERNLGFLSPTVSHGVTLLKNRVDETTDLRQLIMRQLKKIYGLPPLAKNQPH